MSEYQVRDNPTARRFELTVDGEVGSLAAYHVRGDQVIILHTETEPALQGRGLAGELARQTLDQLRDRGSKVVPSCAFFARYIAEHPEYADLVAS